MAPSEPLRASRMRAAAADTPSHPSPAGGRETLRLSEIVERLQRPRGREGPRLVEGWLDQLDATGRWALIKLVTGGLRIGVSARLAKQALADLGGQAGQRDRGGLARARAALWRSLRLARGARRRGRSPNVQAPFRPVMLAHAIADDELKLITPDAYAAEWKWDGIRVQAVREDGVVRLYTRTGDDISHTFPDLVDGLDVEGALDGELLVGASRRGRLRRSARFSDLQQRLNRKTVTAEAAGEPSGLSCASTTAWSTAATTSARCPSASGARGSRRWSARSLSRPHRPVAAPPLRRRRGARRRSARRRPRR